MSSNYYKKRVELNYEKWLTKNHKVGFDLLKKIFGRTKIIVKPRIIELQSRYKTKKWDELKIALISLDSKIKKKASMERKKLNYNTLEFQVYWHKTDSYNVFKEKYLYQIKLAYENNADFICINELGFPYSPRAENFEEENSDLITELKKIANDYETYIIAGTFHDEETLFNTGYIFSPGKEIEDKLPIKHLKKCSALSIGEEIRIPYERYIDYYCYKFGYFTVLICLDSFDPSLIVQVLRAHKTSSPDVDLIFVPSYTPDSYKADIACKEISMATGSIVSYVNCSNYAPQSSVHIMKKEKEGTKLSDNTIIYEIKYEDYLRERQEMYTKYHHDLYDRIMCLKPAFYRF